MSDKTQSKKIILAVPKGRILEELLPVLKSADIVPDDEFFNDKSRALQFTTNRPDIDLIRVRAFDVATFVAFGAAQIGVVGSDVLEEFDYTEIYAPVDLGIGVCRLSLAMPEKEALKEVPETWSHIKVATKYPNLTSRYFKNKGIQAECVKLSGAMEIAPKLGLARRIVDLVSTGGTLKANGLVEIETVMDVSSRLIVNRTAMKTMPDKINGLIDKISEYVYSR